ncbi:MAG: cation diffusion facilitator family transporter [Candidatus Cloacimonetes bacterium]|nr:cation diffusion facilitator family transporter [Candidatus Cloacimonadota bacterium]
MNRNQAAKQEGWVSVIVNLLLFILKYWAGVMSNSVAMIADAWHTLSDSITSIIVLISARISIKPADRNHPYGHGRAELIASLIIGVLLGVVSFEFLREAVHRFSIHESATFGKTAIIVTCISIVLKEGLAQYAMRYGKKYKLLSLEADGKHHRSDALSSVVVLAGILISAKFWWIDSLLGVLVAVIIGFAAFEVLQKSADKLLGNKSEEEVVVQVESVCKEMAESCGIDLQPHHFHEHVYGQHTEVTFHVFVPGNWEITKGHNLIEEIEVVLRQRYQIEATIHLEPKGDI